MQIAIPPNNTREVTINIIMAEAGIVFSFRTSLSFDIPPVAGDEVQNESFWLS